jgi:hypothetical protein
MELAMILEPEMLDHVYRCWLLNHQGDDFIPDRRFARNSYQLASRRYNTAFESWLFEQGFSVIQRDKKRYLNFHGEPRKLTYFLLKYGAQ